MNKKCELNVPRCRKWRFRFTKTRLAAALRPNPLGELTVLGFRGEGRDGEGRDRPAHFLIASAAYGCCPFTS